MRSPWLYMPATLFLLLGMVACGDDGVGPGNWIVVQAFPTGEDLDADGYTVSVNDGSLSEPMETDAYVSLELDPGTYTIELTDLASNCSVELPASPGPGDSENPVTVELSSGEVVAVNFHVVCEPL
ncbi:MAG TPA: hypothetical protein VM198_01620 [Longimicrobiales bacterium]|nr:hypothetical protein [Longimicrobiales bacterium]